MAESFSSRAIHIFYLYAPEDENAREALDKHLALLKQKGFITSWSNSKLLSGAHVANETMRQLNNAHIVLLLISADFMNLYFDSPQMKRAQELHSTRNVTVIPVLIRTTNWREDWLSDLQALPANGTFVMSRKDQDEAFFEVAQGIRRSVNAIQITSTFQIPNGTAEQYIAEGQNQNL